jgi:gluconate 2-dehydrogenase gamma chain
LDRIRWFRPAYTHVEEEEKKTPRRTFLLQAATAGGALLPVSDPVAAPVATPPPADTNSTSASFPYQSLSPDEAAFVEALVNVMCPADEYSPNGVDCGLATYMDRQLAGPYGKGDGRYQRGPFRSGKPQLGLQLPLTPEQFCKAGIAAANAACARGRGKSFDQLTPLDAEQFLKDVQSGQVLDERVALESWFKEVIYPLFVEACFADPMYGGNRNAVFWKLIGYPGLPATHALDMTQFRGKPYTSGKSPKSIADFT